MYCPTCGSEERQLSQYCRACGTDLRSVRTTLERPDAVTASAVSAREEISRAVAQQIRDLDSSRDLKRIAEDVLPELEKFLESPEEKRLRRIRTGVVTAAIGLGVTLLMLMMSVKSHDMIQFAGVGIIAFFIGLGILINGLIFTIPRRAVADYSDEALAQRVLDSQLNRTSLGAGEFSNTSTNELGNTVLQPSSVTEHTTKHLGT